MQETAAGLGRRTAAAEAQAGALTESRTPLGRRVERLPDDRFPGPRTIASVTRSAMEEFASSREDDAGRLAADIEPDPLEVASAARRRK
ncbi:hypothetical protein AQJ58_22490 [Streptomyces sp. DSM 15324]|nr:hypothetical protein AQJ58_22490 [Streptomyces sp. DSM 15324]